MREIWRTSLLANIAIEIVFIGIAVTVVSFWQRAPLLCGAILAFVVVNVAFHVWHRRYLLNRYRPGFCRGRGYDLRATPDRCPECGRRSENALTGSQP